jgi:hypothetical protein
MALRRNSLSTCRRVRRFFFGFIDAGATSMNRCWQLRMNTCTVLVGEVPLLERVPSGSLSPPSTGYFVCILTVAAPNQAEVDVTRA